MAARYGLGRVTGLLIRRSYLGVIILAVAAASAMVYAYAGPIVFPARQTPLTVVHIPLNSSVAPSGWTNYTELSSPSFHYPFNLALTIGVNNTILWINDDTVAHTVTSFQVPTGASSFNSNLIYPGKTFTTTLTLPGVYKYFCSWHNWLAGEITVKQ